MVVAKAVMHLITCLSATLSDIVAASAVEGATDPSHLTIFKCFVVQWKASAHQRTNGPQMMAIAATLGARSSQCRIHADRSQQHRQLSIVALHLFCARRQRAAAGRPLGAAAGPALGGVRGCFWRLTASAPRLAGRWGPPLGLLWGGCAAVFGAAQPARRAHRAGILGARLASLGGPSMAFLGGWGCPLFRAAPAVPAVRRWGGPG